MTSDFPWYDSPWLSAYREATRILSQEAPHLLSDFEDAMRVFRVDPSFTPRVLPGFLEPSLRTTFLDLVNDLKADEMEHHELFQFGRLVLHDHPEFTQFQAAVCDAISEQAGEPLEPSYNFLSLYNNLGICKVHMDAPCAKWTLDICLEQSDRWPIHISEVTDWPLSQAYSKENWHEEIVSDAAFNFSSYEMDPGDALLFCGANQWHYRDRIPRKVDQNFCSLLFLHFVPAGAAALVDPASWAAHFNEPSLSPVGDIYRFESRQAG